MAPDCILLKTKVIIYNSAFALRNCVFKYGDEVIEIVNTCKYLGVWCSNKNKLLSENFAYIFNKASKAIFPIQNYSSATLGKLTPRSALKTFHSQILPILLYCTMKVNVRWKTNARNQANTIKVFEKNVGCSSTNLISGYVLRYRSISYDSFTKDFCF